MIERLGALGPLLAQAGEKNPGPGLGCGLGRGRAQRASGPAFFASERQRLLGRLHELDVGTVHDWAADLLSCLGCHKLQRTKGPRAE
jgi:hypothetical protein